ncbi:NHL domain-containing protein [Stratiformator vulcanicus]|uniref:NHL domain-containing protein n=1 Tax=Stratiformator vulcanicus TaxID=2527980 RepID=UPI0028772B91|nr:hypothetical protein [Stratiformator vulcanicus]
MLTIAGTGEQAATGDGGPGRTAAVAEPYGVEIGPDGALYICEIASSRIRRLDRRTRVIETVLSASPPGEPADDKDAGFSIKQPYEVRFDPEGHLFYVDMPNHVVCRFDRQTRKVSVVAGTLGEKGFAGDGGPADKAKFNKPHSICFDGNDGLLVCDIGNHRIRRVDLKTGRISTFAGTGERGSTPDGAPLTGTPLNGPRALDFDGDHTLVLALREGNTIYTIDLREKTLRHVAGTGEKGYTGDGGPAKEAKLAGPKGVAFGNNGVIYFADTESHTVRLINLTSGLIHTIIGDGKRGDGPDGLERHSRNCRLARPHGICVDKKDFVYVGDSENHKVRQYFPAF